MTTVYVKSKDIAIVSQGLEHDSSSVVTAHKVKVIILEILHVGRKKLPFKMVATRKIEYGISI